MTDHTISVRVRSRRNRFLALVVGTREEHAAFAGTMPDRATDPALAFLGGDFLARAVIPPAELALAARKEPPKPPFLHTETTK
jgi:hypothetical protein